MKQLSDQRVTMGAPGSSWEVELFDPVTGKPIRKSKITVRDRRLQISLPAFQGSVAVKLRRLGP
jgi:hypothetical protein